jgi:hypothetical protein
LAGFGETAVPVAPTPVLDTAPWHDSKPPGFVTVKTGAAAVPSTVTVGGVLLPHGTEKTDELLSKIVEIPETAPAFSVKVIEPPSTVVGSAS